MNGMLYHLFYQQLADTISVFNVFRYLTFRSVGSALTALLIAFLVGAALISARAAVKTGYGDNWLRAVAVEAKTLKAMGLKEEAAKSLDAALAEAAAPKSAAVRTHRYLAELRRLRAEL